MSDALWAGWDRTDITPDHPVPLAGFAHRAAWGPSAQVASPLQLRTLALSDGDRQIVIVVADLLYWGDDTAARVAAEVTERFGLPAEQLFLHATHTHSAPVPSLAHPHGIGAPDPGYVDGLCAACVASVGRALTDACGTRAMEVTLARGAAPYHLGVDRRAARDGHPPVALDERVQVLAVRHGTDTVATVFHHACHPVINHANAATPDLTGAAMSALEHDGNAEIALYLQGCCGDINPDRYEGSHFAEGDQSAIDTAGRDLADAVKEVLGGALSPVAVDLGAARTTIELPTADPPDGQTLQRLVANRDDPMMSTWADWLLGHPAHAAEPATLTVSRLRIGPGLTLLGLSAEPTSAYADAVRARFGDRVLTLGYTNGITGYLVTAEQLAQGGYESAEAPYWYGMRGPLLPDAEHLATQALLDAVV